MTNNRLTEYEATIPYTKLSWLWFPPCLILISWSFYFIPRLSGMLTVLHFLSPYVREYDLWIKWLIYGLAAYVMMKLRSETRKPTKTWLLTWGVIWLMLFIEVLARIDGLYGLLDRHYTFGLSSRRTEFRPQSYLVYLIVILGDSESFRPLWAFGISSAFFATINAFLHSTNTRGR